MSYPYGGGGQYSQSDFISPRDEYSSGIPGGRTQQQHQHQQPHYQSNTYPPQLHDYNEDDVESLKAPPLGGYGGGGYGGSELNKNGVPITRGSIAAQVSHTLYLATSLYVADR